MPSAYALPWDVFAASPQPLHLGVSEAGFPSLTLTFGAEGLSTQYVWNTAYVSTDGHTWLAQALTGGAQLNGWFRTQAALTLVSSVAQYGAVGTPGVWTYVAYLLVSAQPSGMRNSVGPILPLQWQVQAFARGPVPIVTVTPAMPSIPDTTPLGAVVAIASVVMDDGSPWAGTLTLSVNPSNIFALSGNSIIVNPNGPGVGPNPQTQVDNIVVAATE